MTANPPTYTFKGKYSTYQVYLRFGKYGNGRTAIELIDAIDHCPVMVATVNVSEYSLLQPGEVIIKNYSENEGVLEFLIENGIIGRPKTWIATGWVTVPVVDLLIQPY